MRQDNLNPITHGGGVFRTPSNFAAFGDPLKVKCIEMFHADFSYLSIYSGGQKKDSPIIYKSLRNGRLHPYEIGNLRS